MLIAKNQSGFSLLEVVLVLGLMSIVYTLFIQSQATDSENFRAQQIGIKLHEYQTATRRFATLNAANPDILNQNTNEVGSGWLKLQNECVVPAGLENSSGEVGLIPCEFPDTAINGLLNTTFASEISKGDKNTPLRIKTVIDMTTNDAEGNIEGVLNDAALSIAALAANGGSFSSALSIAGQQTTTVEPYMSSSSSTIIYCPIGFTNVMLNDECEVDGDLRNGVFVMITEAHPQTDIWVRNDGGNTMNNTLRFNENTPSEFREIANVNRIYNLTGEILKLGNSGVFDSDIDDWTPTLGDGVVIDTDAKFVGNILVDGDIETLGEIYAEGDIISEGFLYANEGISTLGDADITGSAIVLGSGIFQNGLNVIGETNTDSVNVSSFVEAQEVYSRGNVYAETAISSPYVRASVGLYSEGDLLVVRDSFIGGNTYVGDNVFVKGDVYSEGNLIANQGSAYLGATFVDVIYDNNGNYMLDPSDISRVNVMRANRYAAGAPNATLNMNANSILFAAESESCTTGSAECATSLEGFWDIENLFVRRDNPPDTGIARWERLADWLEDINLTTNQIDTNIDTVVDEFNTNPNLDYLECVPAINGVIYLGVYRPYMQCP